jgi:ribosomal protein S21
MSDAEAFVLQVDLREGESPESLLARFNKMIQREGVLREAKSRRHFISNSELARIAARKAARRRRRKDR